MLSFINELETKSGTYTTLAPLAHTPYEILDDFINFANINNSDIGLEIGYGDGRIMLYLAKTLGIHIIGFEKDEEALKESNELIENELLNNNITNDILSLLSFRQDDLLNPSDNNQINWDEITFVYGYLTKTGLKKLMQFLSNNMKNGSQFISIQFSADGYEANEEGMTSYIDHRGEEIQFKFYKYIM